MNTTSGIHGLSVQMSGRIRRRCSR